MFIVLGGPPENRPPGRTRQGKSGWKRIDHVLEARGEAPENQGAPPESRPPGRLFVLLLFLLFVLLSGFAVVV